ncbi:MAG: sulfotransferase [Caldilineales bacterium]
MAAVPARLHQTARRLAWGYRRATWWARQQPDFLIIGAQRSGTTSLHAYLQQHPHLLSASKKELHFFDGGLDARVDTFTRGEHWYRAHFPCKSLGALHRPAFEASALYSFSPWAAPRIAAQYPQIKLIVLLRNPVERAISHYFHEVQRGYEPLPLLDALHAEEERLRPALEQQNYKDARFIHYSYKRRGVYHDQLRWYRRYFAPDQLLVLLSEAFFADAQATLQRVFQFVGVDDRFQVKDLRPRNAGQNQTPVSDAVYAYLHAYFQPHNQSLDELLGFRCGW